RSNSCWPSNRFPGPRRLALAAPRPGQAAPPRYSNASRLSPVPFSHDTTMTSLKFSFRALALPLRTFSLVCAASLAMSLGGAAQAASSTSTQGTSMSTSPRVSLHTSQGDILIELDAEKAPKSVENFLTYVKEGFYDGTIFHRVIPNF